MRTVYFGVGVIALQASRGVALASSFHRPSSSKFENSVDPHRTKAASFSPKTPHFRRPSTIPPIAAAHGDNSAAEGNQQGVSSIRGGGRKSPRQLAKSAANLDTTSSEVVPHSVILDNIPAFPTMSEYLKFALPCLGLWIAGPLLSLVDTAFVGLSGSPEMSAKQLAALGPATTFLDGATFLFMFLNVATTNLYSSARAASEHRENKVDDPDYAAESVVRTAARLSLRFGLGIMIFLLAFCKPLLQLYIGAEAAKTPGLLQWATEYVVIRALHMPTSLLLGVLQAALLGAKDSVTPLVAILYSTIVNVVGDYLLVSRMKMGLAGAAYATTLAQWAGTAAIIGAARKKLVHDGNLSMFNRPKDGKYVPKVESSFEMVSSRSFLSFAAPVLTLIIGKLAAFGFMTNAAAGLPGQPMPLASHQIILSLLFFCCPFFEVIGQTAQSFLPPFLAPIGSFLERSNFKSSEEENQPAIQKLLKPWKEASKKVSTTLLGLGFLTAAGVASIASLVPAYFGWMITSDTGLQQALKPMAKYLWLGAFAWAPVAVGEGVLLAHRDLKFLAFVYLFSTAMLPPALLYIKAQQGNVGQVWLAFGIFQIFRALCFTGRIWWVPFVMNRFLKKKNKDAATSSQLPAAA